MLVEQTQDRAIEIMMKSLGNHPDQCFSNIPVNKRECPGGLA